MITIKGYSDDIVNIDGSKKTNCEKYGYGEIDCYDKNVFITFEDDTKIKIFYGDGGIWKINILKQGTAKQTLTVCEEEKDGLYSDIFEIDSEIKNIRKV